MRESELLSLSPQELPGIYIIEEGDDFYVGKIVFDTDSLKLKKCRVSAYLSEMDCEDFCEKAGLSPRFTIMEEVMDKLINIHFSEKI